MQIQEIILKKEKNKPLSKEELSYSFLGYLHNKITDKDMTKLLKAICRNNLNEQETIDLTDIFIESGKKLNLKGINAIDKHSTGGVGDKTTLILAPILASLDVYVAKMSGRALGITGGTIDKLESIKGFKTSLTEKQFIKELQDIKMVITSQTEDLCPLDKKVYALRDVTNTTNNVGLIASSIMSKKIALGTNQIFIDIKVGKGALVKNIKEATQLANIMIKIGKNYHKKVICILTKMDNPLGDNIGNAIEVKEVMDILQNKKENQLKDLIVQMCTNIVSNYKNITETEAKKQVIETIQNGLAYQKFLEFIKYQKGDINSIKLSKGTKIYSQKSGYIKSIDAKIIGHLSMQLGAGRINKEDKIDYKAGIILNKNINDKIEKNDLLCTIYGKKPISLKELYKAFKITKLKPKKQNIIIKVIE